MEVTDWENGNMDKQVMWPMKSFRHDYVQQADFLKEAQEQIRYNQENLDNPNFYTCSDRFNAEPTDAGYFFPILVTDLVEEGETYTYDGGLCFDKIQFSY